MALYCIALYCIALYCIASHPNVFFIEVYLKSSHVYSTSKYRSRTFVIHNEYLCIHASVYYQRIDINNNRHVEYNKTTVSAVNTSFLSPPLPPLTFSSILIILIHSHSLYALWLWLTTCCTECLDIQYVRVTHGQEHYLAHSLAAEHAWRYVDLRFMCIVQCCQWWLWYLDIKKIWHSLEFPLLHWQSHSSSPPL